MQDILLHLTCKLEDPDGSNGTKAAPAGLWQAAAQPAGSWASWGSSLAANYSLAVPNLDSLKQRIRMDKTNCSTML